MQSLLPQDCLLCGDFSKNEILCNDCRCELPYLTPSVCSCCSLPTSHGEICGLCLKKPPHFNQSIAAFSYTFPMDRLIQDLKYRPNLAIAPLLGKLMFENLRAPMEADYLIPMPLSKKRLRERGFNQAMEISRSLSHYTGIPILKNGYSKIIETSAQASLAWKDRAKNMRNAFNCDISLNNKKIIVVDDVMTTGASLEEFAKVLRKQGAEHITNWIVARTLTK